MEFKTTVLVLIFLTVAVSGCVSSGYDINTETRGEGSVVLEPSYVGYEPGTMVDFRAEPSKGWTFSHWEGDVRDIYTDNQEFGSEIQGDKTVKAVFKPLHNVEIEEPEGQGIVSPKPGTHEHAEGEVVEIKAEPELGWKLSHWDGDVGSEESPSTNITVDEDENVKAIFKKAFAGGSGTKSDPYLIENTEQLQYIDSRYDKYHFALSSDIDASETKNQNLKNHFATEPLDNDGDAIFNTRYAPIVEGSMTVYYDGIPQEEDTYIIDHAEGKIEFYTHPSEYEGDGYVPTGVQIVSGVSVTYQTTEGKPKGFKPLFNSRTPFVGSLDGQSHTISNLYINRPQENQVGLFQQLNGEVKNLQIENANITGNSEVGIVAGLNEGEIANTQTNGQVKSSGDTGGIAGTNGGTIRDSYSSATVEGGSYSAGIAGYNDAGEVTKTEFEGQVIGISTAGIVGRNSRGEVSETYSSGTVSGELFVGGIVASNYGSLSNSYSEATVKGEKGSTGGVVGSNGDTVSNTYSTGEVETEWEDGGGGLIGGSNGGEVSNSFWNSEISGQESSAGGTELSTNDMQDISTYTEAGWDLSEIWEMEEYPVLQFQ